MSPSSNWESGSTGDAYGWRRNLAVLVGLVAILVVVVWIFNQFDPNKVDISGASDAVVATEVFERYPDNGRLDGLGVRPDPEDLQTAAEGVAVVVPTADTRFDIVLLTFHTPLNCEHPDLYVTVGDEIHFEVIEDIGRGCDTPGIPIAIAVDLAADIEHLPVSAERAN